MPTEQSVGVYKMLVLNCPKMLEINCHFLLESTCRLHQVTWYDMERNGDCFDESIIKNDGDEKDLLNRLGLLTTCVDMNEDTDKNKADRSRVFVFMDNGDCYELEMRKLTKEQQRESCNFYGGR